MLNYVFVLNGNKDILLRHMNYMIQKVRIRGWLTLTLKVDWHYEAEQCRWDDIFNNSFKTCLSSADDVWMSVITTTLDEKQPLAASVDDINEGKKNSSKYYISLGLSFLRFYIIKQIHSYILVSHNLIYTSKF